MPKLKVLTILGTRPEIIRLSRIMARLGVGLLIIPQKPWREVEKELTEYNTLYREINGTNAPQPISAGWIFVDESAERAREMVARIGEKDGGMLDWMRAAQKHGALAAGDPAQAVKQLESLVKGVAFWPQVALGQPPLTAPARKKLAQATVDLFLSHYGA